LGIGVFVLEEIVRCPDDLLNGLRGSGRKLSIGAQ
jgi:hypothetical protein